MQQRPQTFRGYYGMVERSYKKLKRCQYHPARANYGILVLDSGLPPVKVMPISPAPVRQRSRCYVLLRVGHIIFGVTASAVGREHASGQHNLPFVGYDHSVLGDEIPFLGALTC